MPEYMTIREVAAMIRSSERSVYEWLRVGKLGGVRAGSKWLITQEDVDRFLNAGRVAAAADRAPAPAAEILSAAISQAPGLSGTSSPAPGPSAAGPGSAAARPNANPLAAMNHRKNKRNR